MAKKKQVKMLKRDRRKTLEGLALPKKRILYCSICQTQRAHDLINGRYTCKKCGCKYNKRKKRKNVNRGEIEHGQERF